MGLLEWLFRPPRFKRFEDSFAINRANLWPSLRTAIQKQHESGYSVWIVTHFADTFAEIQELLVGWQLDYQIADESMQPATATDTSNDLHGEILLVLADLLVPAESLDPEPAESTPIAMIVLERHPIFENDERLEQFARDIPCPIRFGYYLSIEDIVVSRVVNDTTKMVLKQLGMRDHELITSNMITNRLNKLLKRESSKFRSNHRADSAEQWYQLNSEES